ncbi:MAG: SDR family NAD(P)-dependent oxidoreductase [Opitutales bacterium]
MPKTILVTGASRGLGRAIAERLAVDYDLILHASSEASLEGTLEAIRGKEHNKIEMLPADFSSPEEQETFCKELKKLAKDGLGGVVNNAGIALDKPLLYQPIKDIDLMLNVNLRAPILIGKTAFRIFLKQQHGVIINIGSIAGEVGNAYQSVYAATKAALSGLSKSWSQEATELAPGSAIRALTINPGFFQTEMIDKIPEAIIETYRKRIPSGRFGNPQELANFVAFLFGPDAAYLNGVDFSINGGIR